MFFDADDVRDDLASLLDDDRIAHSNSESIDLVAVVKAGTRDGGSSNFHRFQIGDGSQRARLSNLYDDVEDFRYSFVAFPLVGDDPTRCFAGVAEFCLLFEVVDFDDQTVDFKVQLVQGLHHRLRVFKQRVDVRKHGGAGACGNTVLPNEFQEVGVSLRGDAF